MIERKSDNESNLKCTHKSNIACEFTISVILFKYWSGRDHGLVDHFVTIVVHVADFVIVFLDRDRVWRSRGRSLVPANAPKSDRDRRLAISCFK